MKNTYNSEGGFYRASGWRVSDKDSRTENDVGYQKTWLNKLYRPKFNKLRFSHYSSGYPFQR